MCSTVVWFNCAHLQKYFLKVLQNLQENICAGVLFSGSSFRFLWGNVVGIDLSINFRGLFAAKYLTTSPRRQSNFENAAAICYKAKAKLNISSSLLFLNLLLKSTHLSKQDSSKFLSHRAIFLVKSVRFIYFRNFSFFGNLIKNKVRFLSCFCCIYKLHQETILQCVFNRISNHVLLQAIALLLKYDDNPNINKTTFH